MAEPTLPEPSAASGAESPSTCSVLGTMLAVTDYERAVAQACAWARARESVRLIAAANSHVVAMAWERPKYWEKLARFDLILPDGMPLVWAMNRQLAEPLRDRVYGPTFMLRCLEADPQGGHVLFGSTPEVQAALRARLAQRIPELEIQAGITPPMRQWSRQEEHAMVDQLWREQPRWVWVALGAPRQEEWLARWRDSLPPAVYVGVGAAFAFHAGKVRQAPRWMQRAGLEWLFRVAAEPRRLWKRYLVYNTKFLWALWRERRKKSPLADQEA